MNLLDELTVNGYQIPRTAAGKRVSFALEGEEAEEKRLEREHGMRVSANEKRRASARELVLAALREGRARYEFDITHATGLSYPTAINILRKLRLAGEVEFHHVGNFRLWSRTLPADDSRPRGAVANAGSAENGGAN